MLYLENPADTFAPMDFTQPIGGFRYQPNIETLWSADELAAVGLFVPVDPGVPEGKVSDGFIVQRVDGVVTKVYNLKDAEVPGPLALEPYQFRAMLKLSGKETQLMAVLNGLPEPAKTVALAKLEYSLTFRRDNDLVEQARRAMGLTPEALDALWLQAAGIA